VGKLIFGVNRQFMVYNAILRQFPQALFEVFEKSDNFFSTTIHVLQSAVVKIARNTKIPDGLILYRGLSMKFPRQFFATDENGCRGFAEWGFMSTTANRDIAVMYSGVREGKPTATVLQIKTNSINRAACIEMYSQYQEEREFLWVPLSFLQPEGAQIVEASRDGLLRIITVSVNSNGTALTTGDLLEKKKQLHMKGFRSLVDELRMELDRVGADSGEQDGVESLRDSVIDECDQFVKIHDQIPSEEYTNAATFKRLNQEMLELHRFGRSKVELWLAGGGTLSFVLSRPSRTCHRLLISHLQQKLNEMPPDDAGVVSAALKLCTLMGLVQVSTIECNELGESRLIQAAADNCSSSALRLLIQANANVNACTSEGYTAAFRAAQYGHADCLQALIHGSANIEYVTHEGGGSPLLVAAQNGHTDCISVLLEARADVNHANHKGATPVFVAAQFGKAACIPLLSAAGADVDLAIETGVTPTFVAVAYDHVDCVRALKAAGADINTPHEGQTPLEFALQEGHTACALELGGKC
jgi:hypothetical protein